MSNKFVLVAGSFEDDSQPSEDSLVIHVDPFEYYIHFFNRGDKELAEACIEYLSDFSRSIN